MVLEKRDQQVLAEHHNLFLILGILMFVFGILLMIFPFIGTFAINFLLGITFFVTGIVSIITGSVSRSWKGSTYVILNGVLMLIFGAVLLFFPLAGIITLTLLMSVLLIIQGLFEIGKSSHLNHKSWRRIILTDGIFSLILGILVLLGWPSDSEWVIGLMVGISLVLAGITSIAFSSAIKKGNKK